MDIDNIKKLQMMYEGKYNKPIYSTKGLVAQEMRESSGFQTEGVTYLQEGFFNDETTEGQFIEEDYVFVDDEGNEYLAEDVVVDDEGNFYLAEDTDYDFYDELDEYY